MDSFAFIRDTNKSIEYKTLLSDSSLNEEEDNKLAENFIIKHLKAKEVCVCTS
jgi:hypothetical protein